MVLPPQYEEMRRARVNATPSAFHDVLSEAKALDRYELSRIEPPHQPSGWVGPVVRPAFEVWTVGPRQKLVARLLPDGSSECLDPTFGPLLEKMLALIGSAGQKAHDDFLAEYARLRNEGAG
jgi:hypothetical protein